MAKRDSDLVRLHAESAASEAEGGPITHGELVRMVKELRRELRDADAAHGQFAEAAMAQIGAMRERMVKLENDRRWSIAIIGTVGAVLGFVINALITVVTQWPKK